MDYESESNCDSGKRYQGIDRILFKEPLKNVYEAASGRQKEAKNLSNILDTLESGGIESEQLPE